MCAGQPLKPSIYPEPSSLAFLEGHPATFSNMGEPRGRDGSEIILVGKDKY